MKNPSIFGNVASLSAVEFKVEGIAFISQVMLYLSLETSERKTTGTRIDNGKPAIGQL